MRVYAQVTIVSVIVAFVAGLSAPTAAAELPVSRTWLALGDSYSSGEGISGTQPPRPGQKDCARATGEGTKATAWAVGAYREVQQELSLTELNFVACTGAIDDDVTKQIEEARKTRKPGLEGWNIASFSFGGNSLGFKDILEKCIDVNEIWGVLDPSPGCDTSKREIERRIDVLTERIPFSSRGILGKVTLPELYDTVAKGIVRGGDVIVVGYPNIIEEAGRWPSWRRWVGSGCERIQPYDVPMLREVTAYLNQAIREAVDAANSRHQVDGVQFHFVDIAHNPYETSDRSQDRHALCSGKPWINGVTLGGTSGDYRKERSFHPKQLGHTATARVVADMVRSQVRFDDVPSVADSVVSPADPTLGAQLSPFSRGYGESRPSDIDGGVDSLGMVSNIHWKTWGGPTAVGEGSAIYLRPGSSAADSSAEPAEVVAFNLGICRGKLMYQSVTWFAPQHGESFHPNSSLDLCTESSAYGN